MPGQTAEHEMPPTLQRGGETQKKRSNRAPSETFERAGKMPVGGPDCRIARRPFGRIAIPFAGLGHSEATENG